MKPVPIYIRMDNIPEGGVKAIVIRTDGSVEALEPENGEVFNIKEEQAVCGGYIERHRLPNITIEGLGDDLIMVINEDGLFTEEPNPTVTGIWRHSWIHGDVLITSVNRID